MTELSSSEQLKLLATNKRQALIWLAVSLVLSGVLIILWLYGNSIATESVSKITAIEKSAASVKAVHLSEHIDNLDDLNDDVAPIEFKTVVRDMRDYPPEFKDKIYINNNRGKWTLQVMSVSEHDIIRDYLRGRDDREKFAYFRYTDQNDKSKYMLTYGVVGSLNEAMTLANEVDFGLPKSVKVEPEEMKRYASMIDSYERSEAVLDMSRNRPRSIILKKTNYVVPVPVKKTPGVDNIYSGYLNKESAKTQNVPSNSANVSVPTTGSDIPNTATTNKNVPKANTDTSVPKTNRNVPNNSYNTPVQSQQAQRTKNAPVNKQPTQVIKKRLADEPTVSLAGNTSAPQQAVNSQRPPQQAPQVTATPRPVAPQRSTQQNYQMTDNNTGGNGQMQQQPESKQFVPGTQSSE